MIRLNYFPIPDFQNAINGDYEYTCEQPAKWSPYNCNLQMGAIKVGRSKTLTYRYSFQNKALIHFLNLWAGDHRGPHPGQGGGEADWRRGGHPAAHQHDEGLQDEGAQES